MLLEVALQHVMHVQYALQQYYTIPHTPYTATTTSSVQEYVCMEYLVQMYHGMV
jgi:hypothetical protein